MSTGKIKKLFFDGLDNLSTAESTQIIVVKKLMVNLWHFQFLLVHRPGPGGDQTAAGKMHQKINGDTQITFLRISLQKAAYFLSLPVSSGRPAGSGAAALCFPFGEFMFFCSSMRLKSQPSNACAAPQGRRDIISLCLAMTLMVY
ncbi:MAG TPA: hypothetical protein VEM40_11955 [Nitrospirota bacterium]|nr:hypothetical protein [Nitrospirota bacterium]